VFRLLLYPGDDRNTGLRPRRCAHHVLKVSALCRAIMGSRHHSALRSPSRSACTSCLHLAGQIG